METDFRPTWWLPGPHLQSSWAAFTRPTALVRYRREAIETADGDELVLDHIDGPAGPRVILLHGLEGSAHAVYIQGMAALASRAGWAVTAVNFRSCARDPGQLDRMLPNRRPRLYHSGDTGDLDLVIGRLSEREPDRPFFGAGVSLGGNVLLKWLGERAGPSRITAAATISVPYDLAECAANLSGGVNRVYTSRFLRTLKPKVTELASRFPEARKIVDMAAADRAMTFAAFDHAVTAPLHGFTSAADYYARSSSLGFLGRIACPTLCISAADDPFQPRAALARAQAAASPATEVRITRTGGHAGFVQGSIPGATSAWAEQAAMTFFAARLKPAAP